MLKTEFDIAADVRFLQPENAYLPILVTEPGIVTEVKFRQSLNVLSPMLKIELGIVIDVKFRAALKASLLMLVTEYVLPLCFTVAGISMWPLYSSGCDLKELPLKVTSTFFSLLLVILKYMPLALKTWA